MNKSSSNHFFRCATASPQWVETVQNGHVLIMDIGQQTFSHELGSEWVSGASERMSVRKQSEQFGANE